MNLSAFWSAVTSGLQEWQQGPKCAQRLDRNFSPAVLFLVLNDFLGYLNFHHLRNNELSCPVFTMPFYRLLSYAFRTIPFPKLWSFGLLFVSKALWAGIAQRGSPTSPRCLFLSFAHIHFLRWHAANLIRVTQQKWLILIQVSSPTELLHSCTDTKRQRLSGVAVSSRKWRERGPAHFSSRAGWNGLWSYSCRQKFPRTGYHFPPSVVCPAAHTRRCGCAISVCSHGRKLFPFFCACMDSTRFLCWTSSATGRRGVEWDCSSKSIGCCGIAAGAPHTEAIPHLCFHPSLYLFYLYFFSDEVEKTTCNIQDVGLQQHWPPFVLLLFFLTISKHSAGSFLLPDLFFSKSYERKVWDLFPE